MDPVRRQLKLLDARLAEREAGAAGLLTYCPLFLPALAFIMGILVENRYGVPIRIVFFALLPAVAAIVLSWAMRGPRGRLYAAGAAACLVFFCVGAVRLKCYHAPRGDDVRNLISHGRALATIRGHVKTVPSTEDPDLWKFGRYHWGETGCRFYLKARQAASGREWADISGTVFVLAPAETGNLCPGDYVQLHCWLDGFGDPANPGQFDIKKSLGRRNIHVCAAVSSTDGIKVLEEASSRSLAGALAHLRRRTSGALLDEILAENDAAPVLTALLLGHRSGIDVETADAFQKTNLAHFISLSGMHLGILAMTGWAMLRASGISRRWRSGICILMIGLYVLIVPMRAPTLRAAMICWVFFLSVIFARKANAFNTLAIAAIAGLLMRPADVLTAGWQLSYLTVTGILLFHRPISNRILELLVDPLHARLKDSRAFWVTGVLTKAIDLFAVGAAAWLGGAGVLLYHFGSIGPLAAVWTVFVFPLVWGILLLGFAKMILTFVLPTLALVLGLVLSAFGNAFIFSVKFLAGLGLSELRIGAVSGFFVAGCYTLLLLVRFNRLQRPVYRKALAACAAAAIIIPLWVTRHARSHPDDLEMTSLAVGHGQAIFVSFPGGRTALFDAGSSSSKNCGWRTVVPFLRRKGVGRIDDLVISHADVDHVNGIPEIAATVKVGHIWTSSAVLKKAASVSTAGYLNSCLKSLGYTMEVLEGSVELDKGARLSLLWPTREACDDDTIGDNDKSMVFLIEFAGRRILLCSDIELHAQDEILDLNPDLRADVIVMPHHGSTANLVDGFVERLEASIAIVNCSEGKYTRAYRACEGVNGLYTPVDGAVTVKIKADGTLSATGFLNETSNSSTR